MCNVHTTIVTNVATSPLVRMPGTLEKLKIDGQLVNPIAIRHNYRYSKRKTVHSCIQN